uniref:Addiction module antidote protein, HigA family n=1 Tax=Candidatus Kentrum sp. LPFa TaxID=2126335 RepID=A0A450W1A5_9GAMM|nr:MAG: addiction module antidote protein, HigA family [Candidatus Kentron sp. LPFa]VFK24453.1 MAG: addiction module antidote protein, HigA family [Candidatus Kentron sp. LPFa]
MAMHNPPHPGAFIQAVYLTPNEISRQTLALKLGVDPPTLDRILNEIGGVTSEMALRLSKVLGRSPESWLAMQDNYDLWQARHTVDLENIRKIAFEYA